MTVLVQSRMTKVRDLSDLPVKLADAWEDVPHYSDDRLTIEGTGRAAWRITGFYEFGADDEGARRYVLRFEVNGTSRTEFYPAQVTPKGHLSIDNVTTDRTLAGALAKYGRSR